MAEKQLIERAEQALYKVYNRFPVVFDHGEGVKLYDTEGREYLDFGAGIAVMALGYGDEEYTKAVEDQLHRLTHISNLFYNQPSIDAGEKLLQASQMDKVFFTNSGTEYLRHVSSDRVLDLFVIGGADDISGVPVLLDENRQELK